jgi:hypothetical protein
MQLDHFLAEATALARPGTLLRNNGSGEPTAFWHGFDMEGRVMSLLHAGSWLTLKTDSRLGPTVTESTRDELTGRPLFAEPYLSLPPVDVVFLQGSQAIGAYLEQNDWERDEPFNPNFKHPTAAAYGQLWRENCPMYRTDIVAVSGGWLFPWPDIEWDELIAADLVLWTLEGAEPWFDVYAQEGRYTAYEHAT